MLGGDVVVSVVLHHREVVLVGQLQYALGARGAQAKTRWVVEHAHAHKEFGAPVNAQLLKTLQDHRAGARNGGRDLRHLLSI